MSRLLSGIVIVMFVVLTTLIVGTVSALFEGDTEPVEGASFTNCQVDEDDFETCQDVGKTAFLNEVFGASITPFCSGDGCDGFPGFLNAIWILVMGMLLVAGVLLIVVSFVPTLGN